MMTTLDGVIMTNIVKICKIHGELTNDQTRLNRLSPKGKPYLRCGICRNNQERSRLKDKYIKLPNTITKTERSYAYTIQHRFKISISEYNIILEKQNYVCAICKNPETQLKRNYNKVKMLSVDHCHQSGKIRGLLCHKCNIGIGAFKDSILLLNSAIDYLKTN